MFLSYSLVCAAGATEHPPSMDEVQENAGKAPATGTASIAQAPTPAPAPVRNTQALPKHTQKHTRVPLVFSMMTGNLMFPTVRERSDPGKEEKM